MKNKRIVVLMGGPSSEREVSLNTGKAILAALLEKGYDAVGVEIDPPRLAEQLKEYDCDIVFNAVHGMYGEDGRLQGALEMLAVPYTGSGVLASAIAMNKVVSKQLFLEAGISTPRFKTYEKSTPKERLLCEIVQDFSIPVVVKSAAQGSSIGVTIVEEAAALQQAIEHAFQYDDVILVEEFIKGRELTVAVLGSQQPEALPVIEIAPHSGRYDYQSKYTKGATEYLVPAPLEQRVTKEAQEMAVKTFKLFGCNGVARADLMLDDSGALYLLEINTVPGMTATSLVPKAADAVGVSFPELCEKLLLMVGTGKK